MERAKRMLCGYCATEQVSQISCYPFPFHNLPHFSHIQSAGFVPNVVQTLPTSDLVDSGKEGMAVEVR